MTHELFQKGNSASLNSRTNRQYLPYNGLESTWGIARVVKSDDRKFQSALHLHAPVVMDESSRSRTLDETGHYRKNLNGTQLTNKHRPRPVSMAMADYPRMHSFKNGLVTRSQNNLALAAEKTKFMTKLSNGSLQIRTTIPRHETLTRKNSFAPVDDNKAVARVTVARHLGDHVTLVTVDDDSTRVCSRAKTNLIFCSPKMYFTNNGYVHQG